MGGDVNLPTSSTSKLLYGYAYALGVYIATVERRSNSNDALTFTAAREVR